MTLLRAGLVHLALLFGLEMMLDATREPAAPLSTTLAAGHASETRVEPWCKSSLGQLTVRGVVFVTGATDPRDCPPDRAQRDGNVVATLGEVPNWKGQADAVTFLDARK